MGVATVNESKQSVSAKRTFRPSLSGRHASEWPPSDVSSDLTVEVGTRSFPLHKFPLVSRSGKIRKLLSEAKDPKLSRVCLPAVPGGAEAFELAAKFCYGVAIDITLSNVATLRCAAHFLQMSEEFAEENLEARTEAFIKDSVLPNVADSISVLRHCEALLPATEDVNLVSRLVAAVATNVCREQLTSGLSKLDSLHGKPVKAEAAEPTCEWLGKALSVLNLDLFQRVLSAMKSKGLKQDTVCRVLINYAHSALMSSVIRDTNEGGFSDEEARKKRRVVVETIVDLLPTQSRNNPVQIAFLSGLLKTAILASASATCRADLERRIVLQLEQAILEDVLIPACPYGGNQHQLYDTDVVLRIFSSFLNLDEEDDGETHLGEGSDGEYEFDGHEGSPKQRSIVRVSKLLDSYLAEVALDSNLAASKFIALAELLPEHARVANDGLYRSIDIFLKVRIWHFIPLTSSQNNDHKSVSDGQVHPNIKESERYRLCKTINCRKLCQEACSHAAQNERLPVQMAVQVLYFEQMRLRDAMNAGGGHDHVLLGSAQYAQRPCGGGMGSGATSPRDNYALVRRENRELKLEVARMRRRLTELEKDHVSMRQELVRVNPANRILRSFTRKLGRLNSLFRVRELRPVDPRGVFPKRRHHSIS